jgi:hypothetical protein
MSDQVASITAAFRATPADRDPLSALVQDALPPLRIGPATLYSSALSSICTSQRLGRALGVTGDSPEPTVAHFLMCASHVGAADTGSRVRPIIMRCRQEPMHRESAPAAPVPVGARVAVARQDPMHRAQGVGQDDAARHGPAGAASQTGEASCAGQQDPMHREQAAAPLPAQAAIGAVDADGAGKRVQDPLHREKRADPQPGSMPPANVPQQEPMHRDTAIGGSAAPARIGRGKPTARAEQRGSVALTVTGRQNPSHRGKRTDPPPGSTPPANILHQKPTHREQETTAARTGPLRNGNPRGNPNAAPRCGAKTRSGCPCKAPALRGKLRCRMHGGGSTGPRTAEGLQCLRDARTTHGRFAAATRAHDHFLLSFFRRGRLKRLAWQLETRLPPAAQARLHALPPELAMPPYPHRDQPLPSRVEERAIVQAEAEALAPWKRAIAFARASANGATAQGVSAKADKSGTPLGDNEAGELDQLFAALPSPVRASKRSRSKMRQTGTP